MKTIILTVVSPDRPGLVQILSDVVVKHEGSWGQSSMANLAGQFAGIVTITVDKANAGALRNDLEALNGDGMMVTVSDAGTEVDASLPVIWLEITGHDQPGIVHQVSGVCSELGANLLSLETGVVSGSMSGEAMFVANAEVQLPQGLEADTIQTALEDLSDDLMVDIVLADD